MSSLRALGGNPAVGVPSEDIKSMVLEALMAVEGAQEDLQEGIPPLLKGVLVEVAAAATVVVVAEHVVV